MTVECYKEGPFSEIFNTSVVTYS